MSVWHRSKDVEVEMIAKNNISLLNWNKLKYKNTNLIPVDRTNKHMSVPRAFTIEPSHNYYYYEEAFIMYNTVIVINIRLNYTLEKIICHYFKKLPLKKCLARLYMQISLLQCPSYNVTLTMELLQCYQPSINYWDGSHYKP